MTSTIQQPTETEMETGSAKEQRGCLERAPTAPHSMTLALQSSGDQNGNAFASESSRSSSSSLSSPSCAGGESSPDSFRCSSSGLGSSGSDSPLDVDMQECVEEEHQGLQEDGISGSSIMSTEESPLSSVQPVDCLESTNDNSVSVYLDACDDGHDDDDPTWNNNSENLALVFIQEDNTTTGDDNAGGNHYNSQTGSGGGRRYSDDDPAPLCSSENDDSDDDDGDDDDDPEDSFLSVSSGVMTVRSSSVSSSTGLEGSEERGGHGGESPMACSSSTTTSSTSSSDQEALPCLSPLPTDKVSDVGPADPAVVVALDRPGALTSAEELKQDVAAEEAPVISSEDVPEQEQEQEEEQEEEEEVEEQEEEEVEDQEEEEETKEEVVVEETKEEEVVEEQEQEEETKEEVVVEEQEEEKETKEEVHERSIELLTPASLTEEVVVEVSNVEVKEESQETLITPIVVNGIVGATAAETRVSSSSVAQVGKPSAGAIKPAAACKQTKPAKNDIKTFALPNFRNVKSKIMSTRGGVVRGEQHGQGKDIIIATASPVKGKKLQVAVPVPRRAPIKQDRPADDRRQRSSSGQAREAAATAPKAAMMAHRPPERPGRKPLPPPDGTQCRINAESESEVMVTPEEPGQAGEPGPHKEAASMDVAVVVPGKTDTTQPTEATSGPEADIAKGKVELHENSAGVSAHKTVSSKLRPKTAGLPTSVASVAASGSGSTPATSSLDGATMSLGTLASPRAKAAVGSASVSSRDRTTAGNQLPQKGRQIQAMGIPKMRVPDRTLNASQPTAAASIAPKFPLNAPCSGVSRLPSSSKLPVKGSSPSLSTSSLGSTVSEANSNTQKGPSSNACAKTQGSDERPSRPSPSVDTPVPNKALTSTKPVAMRTRSTSLLGKSSLIGLKTPAQAKPAPSALQRNPSTRPHRTSSATMGHGGRARRLSQQPEWAQALCLPDQLLLVDKNKPSKPAAAPSSAPAPPAPCPAPPSLAPAASTGTSARVQPAPAAPEAEKPQDIFAHYQQQCEQKSQCIQQLRKFLLLGNRRLEALALVVQHVSAEREETLKQKKAVEGELCTVKQELAGCMSCCESLKREKEEARASFEETLEGMRQEQQAELQQLEERLRAFYSAEWDKTHQAYQEEADKCRALMKQQVEEVRSQQEALRKEQEESHAQQTEALKRQYETTLQELQKTHEQNMNALEKTLKDSEASLSRQIEELASENSELKMKLKAEEEKRRILSENSQKDAHTLYLEQELESLKVVVELKTQQLHQQDKKLMQMDKLVETNVKLEECLTKVQQENEDYRARMDRHAALSRQLSSEQAMLQKTLQKESNVVKRLSMENEELMWKLHNCDVTSPLRRLSPQNSPSFPTAPLSPR
ncbi:microtubule-associated tumor suppressor 1 homolog [Engraulis encrasicolus]|uniref:microtubule-associated tumor suppressor 1 homolog n=1 Tax=Engraulis encrasicolus TaxID=184585 RepID=UPI002FD6335D